MVSDRHQALYALSETRNSSNPFSSLHSSRACLLLQPPFKLPQSPKPNLTAKLCLSAKLFDIPLAWTQRATPRRSSLPACTVDSTHPIACKICLVNLEPRNIPPNRSCCNTAHPLIPTILARQASISTQQAHTRTHTQTDNGTNNDHHNPQRVKQRFVTLLG